MTGNAEPAAPAVDRGHAALADVTAIVLAGGLGRRMSADGRGVDKGLEPFGQAPMVAHVIARLAPQVGALLVNANRNRERYERFGHPVVADLVGGFAGPLAGLHAGMSAATTRWVLTAPCDSPFLPPDLARRLREAADRAGARIAMARTGVQTHPVFLLAERALLPDLDAFLAAGGRKIDAWTARVGAIEVDFDDDRAFRNINTRDELAELSASDPGPAAAAASVPAGPPSAARASLADIASCVDGYDPRALRVEAARAFLDRLVEPVATVERVPIRSALGRVLAAEVVSPIDVPAHDNSAMDGYAVRAADLEREGETTLPVAGTALAGRPLAPAATERTAVRVMTGAVMPAGFDTVIPQELVRAAGATVVIPPGQVAGQHRRLRGEDLAAGRPALQAGRVLAPADVGLLASLGIGEVGVRRRIRVAFFSTGDELRGIGEPLGPGEIYDSNRYTMHAMLARLGAEPIDLGVVPDRPEALERAVRAAAEAADAILSSGGVSVGEADYTREVMDRAGEVVFWRIAMRPGRPMAVGRIGRAVYFGLPGNPVAVMITFYFFARHGLLRLMGAAPREPACLRARSVSALRKRPGRTEYQRGILARGADGAPEVRLTGSQGSGVLRSMSEANCIVVLHHDQGDVAAGSLVDCLPFDGLV